MQNSKQTKQEQLTSFYIPQGLFSQEGSESQKEAASALNVFGKVMRAGIRRFMLLTDLSNLQCASKKLFDTDSDFSIAAHHEEAAAQFPLRLMRFISPSRYDGLTRILTHNETDTLLKWYLLSHELLGRVDGIALVCKCMLGCAARVPVQIRVEPQGTAVLRIPDPLRTLLGIRFSRLGYDCTPGRDLIAKSEELHIHVGPMKVNNLQTLQRAGWAAGTGPGRKAEMLAELLVPFNLRLVIHFSQEIEVFSIGGGILKKDRLGVVLRD